MSASKAEAPKPQSAEMAEMIDSMKDADPSIGVVEAHTEDSSETDSLSWMSPEAKENAEAILKDFGEVAVASEIIVAPDVLRHEVYEVDGVTSLPEDDHTGMSRKGIDEITDFLRTEASEPGTSTVTHPATIIETTVGGGGKGGSGSEVLVLTLPEEPARTVAKVNVAFPDTPARKAYLAEEKVRIAGSVDDIMKSSRGVATIERIKTARAEKQHRIDVRETNKGGVRQEVRDAKLNLKITEQTYSRSGKRSLRKVEREKMKSEIDKRRAEGMVNGAQALLAKMGTRKHARAHVEGQSTSAIAKAEGRLQQTKDNKDMFFDKYGRRNNSTRKNYQRVRARVGTGTNYLGAGEVVTTPSLSLGEVWSTDEWTKKRAEAAKRKELEVKARAEADKRKWEAENPVYGPALPVAKTRHIRPMSTRATARPINRVKVTGPKESFS